jgi:glycosyltransferase involved in cell wall biosynthesis
MKRVLIIGSLDLSVGSFRPLPLAKYLPEFGWEPIILTGPANGILNPQFSIVETSYRDVYDFWKKLFGLNSNESMTLQIKRRLRTTTKKSIVDTLLTLLSEILYYPDRYKGWKPFAIKAGNQLLQNEQVDAIISCWPLTGFIVASKLKSRFKTPWIADLTDLWSQNTNYSYGHLRRLLDTRLELKTLSMADAIITISEPLAKKLRELHRRKNVSVIPNGFDPAKVNFPPANLIDKFTITYTGTIYTDKQDPSKLFAALRSLISDGIVPQDEVKVRFYGRGVLWLDREIEKYGLSNVVKQYGLVSKQTSLAKQRESQILLSLDWDDLEEGVYTGKVFEYLGARRPILATGGSEHSVIAELLNETKAGLHAATVEEIKEVLQGLYQEYKLKGAVVYSGEEARVNQYSHREMARKFSEVLNRVIQNLPTVKG